MSLLSSVHIVRLSGYSNFPNIICIIHLHFVSAQKSMPHNRYEVFAVAFGVVLSTECFEAMNTAVNVNACLSPEKTIKHSKTQNEHYCAPCKRGTSSSHGIVRRGISPIMTTLYTPLFPDTHLLLVEQVDGVQTRQRRCL